MFCVKCGSEVRTNAQYCHSCGTTVNVPAEPSRIHPPVAASQPSANRPVAPQTSEGRVTSGLTRGHWIFFSSLAGALLIAFFSGLPAYFTALASLSLHESNPAGDAFSAACGPAYGGAVFGVVIGAGLGWLLTRNYGSKR